MVFGIGEDGLKGKNLGVKIFLVIFGLELRLLHFKDGKSRIKL